MDHRTCRITSFMVQGWSGLLTLGSTGFPDHCRRPKCIFPPYELQHTNDVLKSTGIIINLPGQEGVPFESTPGHMILNLSSRRHSFQQLTNKRGYQTFIIKLNTIFHQILAYWPDQEVPIWYQWAWMSANRSIPLNTSTKWTYMWRFSTYNYSPTY